MINNLAFQMGIDIPFPAAQTSIHQPTLKEIAFINEENYFVGCELLRFSKNSLMSEDKNSLEDQSDFDIIMSIMKDKRDIKAQQSAIAALMVLGLIFPEYRIIPQDNCIAFLPENVNDSHSTFSLNNLNYQEFRQILIPMFCLQEAVSKEYNPQGKDAERIADKFRKRKKKLEEQNPQGHSGDINVFSRYISILSIALKKDKNTFQNYTVYQLLDELERFKLKESYDLYVKAKLAGAKDVKEVDDWMKDLHP